MKLLNKVNRRRLAVFNTNFLKQFMFFNQYFIELSKLLKFLTCPISKFFEVFEKVEYLKGHEELYISNATVFSLG